MNGTNSSHYFDSYGKHDVHRLMLADRPRMQSYAAALAKLAPGRVIADVGAGTGILSVMAAQAGAKFVFAIEANQDMKTTIKRLAEANGVGQKVIVITELAENVTPQVLAQKLQLHLSDRQIAQTDDIFFSTNSLKVDLIVSEWMGFHLFHENMLPSVLSFRDKCLNQIENKFKPWQMLPSNIELICYLVSAPDLYQSLHGLEDSYADLGINITSLGYAIEEIPSPHVVELNRRHIASETVTILKEDLISLPATFMDDENFIIGKDSFRLSSASFHNDEETSYLGECGALHGIGISWVCRFVDYMGHDIISLSTHPKESQTHWKQSLLWLPRLNVDPDSIVNLVMTIRMKQGDVNTRFVAIDMEIEDFEMVPRQ